MEIHLQPSQSRIYDWMADDQPGWIGVGGGRGAAKSGGADRIALYLAMTQPGIVMCIVMRNFDQVRKYHIEPLMRAFPELVDHFYKTDSKLMVPSLTGKPSQIDFSYAESLVDVERRFRSANYKYIIVDQTEQFMDTELREMKNANRWPADGNPGRAKMLLLFNMGGAGCIQQLRKWFHTREFNEHEDPNDYRFLHVYPWDNVEWARDALAADGISTREYEHWDSQRRFDYFVTRTDYGRALNSLDDTLRARDLLGSWESLEGAYFGRVFDRQATLIADWQAQKILREWDTRWISQDWGKSHYCVTLWHGMRTMSPSEVLSALGWSVTQPLRVVVTYRRMIVNELTSEQVGKKIVENTPLIERQSVKQFYLSPDAFGERDSAHTIAMNQGNALFPYQMPQPHPADTDRPGGWGLMYQMLSNTKKKGLDGDLVWLISSECPELLESLPVLMRDPKDLDVVLKTDKGQARMEQDVSEAARYGLKSMLGQAAKPRDVAVREELQNAPDDFTRHLIRLRETELRTKEKTSVPYWAQ